MIIKLIDEHNGEITLHRNKIIHIKFKGFKDTLLFLEKIVDANVDIISINTSYLDGGFEIKDSSNPIINIIIRVK